MIRPKNLFLIVFVLLSFSYSTAMQSPNPSSGDTGQEIVKGSIVDVLLETLTKENVQAAIKQYHSLKKNHSDSYNFDETELNIVGYRILNMGRVKDAIEIFKLNVEVYPDAFNPYDSLGEAYMADGRKELAIRNYKQSVELNPDNENGDRFATILEHYSKKEIMIPMRDGVKLFTQVYAPVDKSQKYPIMLRRTPYSIPPYGENVYRNSLGPSWPFVEEGYIFVFQDCRGKYVAAQKRQAHQTGCRRQQRYL